MDRSSHSAGDRACLVYNSCNQSLPLGCQHRHCCLFHIHSHNSTNAIHCLSSCGEITPDSALIYFICSLQLREPRPGNQWRNHLTQAFFVVWHAGQQPREQRQEWGQPEAWERWQNKTRKRTCPHQVSPSLIKLSNKLSHPSFKLQTLFFFLSLRFLYLFLPPYQFCRRYENLSTYPSPWEAFNHL